MPEKSREPQDPDELPSRKALVARLETQRRDLLRAMACVNRARRTLEEHVAEGPAGPLQRISPKRHEVYEERVLEALNGAGEALATAYPMLERIAAALDVEEMLKEHAPEPAHVEPAVTAQAATKP
ncbi:MAG: hypothetical protein E6J91_31710 [Deltaproteobacteria bacterium]|nr:MAG: hypothetical protein E6J91_31710 [Deltaproteobacteria bacterium]